MTRARLLFLFPALFVLLWSTGWIVAKYASPYAEPLSFLTIRYALAGLLLAAFCFALRATWPRRQLLVHAIFSGVFLHAIYLGGIWWVLDQQMPSTLSGMMAALQPLITAVLAGMIVGEQISTRQWTGFALGFAGLMVALAPRLAADLSGDLAGDLAGTDGVHDGWILLIGVNFVSMISVVIGTLYQKKFLQKGDLRTITTLQYLGAFLATLPAALLLEEFQFSWTLQLYGAMAWSVLGLSLGAVGLFVILIREGEVSRAAALIYLIPPTIAVQAFLVFGERLTPLELGGMVLTVFGVYLVSGKWQKLPRTHL
uniref:DMT family transporter n=1 Tax=Pararhizobium sp. IMCC3301 TaxID=3067904 RepID=UPI002740555C|nr:DMT family transporter [Pararhizobium sp. IMCC3301]